MIVLPMFDMSVWRQFCLAAAVLIALFQCQRSHAQSAATHIHVILPLTGFAASTGESFKNGVILAYDSLTEADRSQLRFTFDDDQMNPVSTIASFRLAMQRDAPDVVVTVTAGTGKALAPVADAQGVMHVAAVSRDTKSCIGRQKCFLFWPDPAEVVRIALEELTKHGYKRVALISAIHDGPATMIAEIDRQKGPDLVIVQREEFNTDVRDFRPFLNKIRVGTSIDAIIVNLFQGQIGLFARQASELGIKLPRFGLEIHGDEREWRSSQGFMTGEAYVGTGFRNSDLISQYRRRFPNASIYASAAGFDLTLVLNAARKHKSDALIEFFRSLQAFPGASGSLSYREPNRVALPPFVATVPAS